MVQTAHPVLAAMEKLIEDSAGTRIQEDVLEEVARESHSEASMRVLCVSRPSAHVRWAREADICVSVGEQERARGDAALGVRRGAWGPPRKF